MSRITTCCFTGHHKIPIDRVGTMITRLEHEIECLIAQGVTDFISGGALGFDQFAASLIIGKKEMEKEMEKEIRLIFALPYRKQDQLWTNKQKSLYGKLLAKADDIVYVSEAHTYGCVKKRNRYMVDSSAFCICGLLCSLNVTDQAVRYAKQKGLRIINVLV